MTSAKDLLDWVKSKLSDDTISMSLRNDCEGWVKYAKIRTKLKPGELARFQKLTEILEAFYDDEKKDISTRKVLTTNEDLSGIFKVTAKTICAWVKIGMPREGVNQYDLRKVLVWWLDNINHTPEDSDKSITEWRRRERAAKAQLAELELQKNKGEVISALEHETQLTSACADLRSTMLSWPSRLFPTDDENRAKLREAVHNLLEMFVKNRRLIISEKKPTKKASTISESRKSSDKKTDTIRKQRKTTQRRASKAAGK